MSDRQHGEFICLNSVRTAVTHLRAVRRAGPEFDTPARYSFTNEADAYEVERALELLDLFLEDADEI